MHPNDRSCVTGEVAPSGRVQVLEGNETVLLVDDEQGVRGLSERILAGAGYRVITAASGEQALDRFREGLHKIDLVLLDVTLPGMGGAACFDRLRELRPNVRVLLSSGAPATGRLYEATAVGQARFIAKPYGRKELLRAVRELLDEETV